MTSPETFSHRHPFKLVEKAERVGEGVIGVVLGSADGVLTGCAGLPPALVIEALAQSILLTHGLPGVVPRLVGIDGARVMRPVAPGDRLEVEAVESGSFGGLRRYACRAVCDGALAAMAEITVSS